ncbi:MAG: hypothetical protein J6Z01_17035 [Bacteroidales bacterium]|nr:hypothetical protein [Bacteroidales bacterium]
MGCAQRTPIAENNFEELFGSCADSLKYLNVGNSNIAGEQHGNRLISYMGVVCSCYIFAIKVSYDLSI